MEKKAQHVIFGTMLMLFIFFLIFTVLMDDLFINPKISEERHQILQHEAQRAANTLLLPGYPENWDINDVERAGLMTNNTYDASKAAALRAIAATDYGKSKDLIGVRHDYLITITTEPLTTIAEPSIPDVETLIASNPKYVAKQARTTIDSQTGKPITITVHVYRHTI